MDANPAGWFGRDRAPLPWAGSTVYGLVDAIAQGGTDLMFLEGDPIKVTAILGNDLFMVLGARSSRPEAGVGR